MAQEPRVIKTKIKNNIMALHLFDLPRHLSSDSVRDVVHITNKLPIEDMFVMGIRHFVHDEFYEQFLPAHKDNPEAVVREYSDQDQLIVSLCGTYKGAAVHVDIAKEVMIISLFESKKTGSTTPVAKEIWDIADLEEGNHGNY